MPSAPRPATDATTVGLGWPVAELPEAPDPGGRVGLGWPVGLEQPLPVDGRGQGES